MMKPQETLTDIRTPHKMAESSGVFIRRWRNMIIEIGVQRPGRIDSVKGKFCYNFREHSSITEKLIFAKWAMACLLKFRKP